MTLDNFIICFEHASAHAETTLLAEGMVYPLFTIVNRRGHVRPVAADFTSEATKGMSLAVVRTMCVAEAATAIFHHSEAWAVLGSDVASGVNSSESGQRIEVLLVAGTVRVGSTVKQKLRIREIERNLLGVISGLRDIPVSALGGMGIQHLPLQGRLVELLPAEPPTFANRWRARGRMAQVTKCLARGRSAFAR